MLLKKKNYWDVSTNLQHSEESGGCDRWNSTSLCKINNIYQSDLLFADKTIETIIWQPFGFCEESGTADTEDSFLLLFNS